MQKFFGPQFLCEFSLLISVCETWQWSGMQNLLRVGKNAGRVWSRLWTKVHNILRWRIRDPLLLSTHLTDCLYLVSFRRYRTLKSPLGCEVGPKSWFSGSRFVEGGIAQISDMRFQITLTSDHVADLDWVRFSELGDWAAKKRRKKKESLVKYKSADILVIYCLIALVTSRFGPLAFSPPPVAPSVIRS